MPDSDADRLRRIVTEQREILWDLWQLPPSTPPSLPTAALVLDTADEMALGVAVELFGYPAERLAAATAGCLTLCVTAEDAARLLETLPAVDGAAERLTSACRDPNSIPVVAVSGVADCLALDHEADRDREAAH